jgi:hypothetical protein
MRDRDPQCRSQQVYERRDQAAERTNNGGQAEQRTAATRQRAVGQEQDRERNHSGCIFYTVTED